MEVGWLTALLDAPLHGTCAAALTERVAHLVAASLPPKCCAAAVGTVARANVP